MAEGKEEWWYEFLGRLCRDVISSIPVLLIFLPGRVRSLKLDYMLCYALAICIWVVTDIMFFLEQDELFREDVCLEATETRA